MDNITQKDIDHVLGMMDTINRVAKTKTIYSLIDAEGNKINLVEIADTLSEYINKHLNDSENETPVNSQMFPLFNNFYALLLGRRMSFPNAILLVSSPMTNHAMSQIALGSALLMRYMDKNKLKIVSETIALTDKEIEMLDQMQKSQKDNLSKLDSILDDKNIQ